MNATNLGTLCWVDRTGGQLTAAERRSLLRPLAHVHAANAAGRLSMLIRLNSGRRRHIAPERTLPPSSALTRAAEEQAQRQLSPALLNHSYRTFAYGAALGAWENSPNVTLPDFINATERDVGTYLYGRSMYEMMTGWENDPAVAGQSPKSAEFAQIWQAAEKVVFSCSLESVSTKRTRLERSFDPALVRQIKAGAGHDLNISGAHLAASAWHGGLIDECHVFVAPMLVGGGKRMFPDDLRQPLKLLDERRFGNGMVFLRYAVSL